jgi:hypothetical protein
MAARFETASVRNSWAKVAGSSTVRRSGNASGAAELDELDDEELDELDELDELLDDELLDRPDEELDELEGSRISSVRTSAART